mmetsp:Transcript_6375/g.17370  ORF Transcript_6375/g.17370 Transcript_6375/m.17370 type:complete len:208 (-) Transcript_6375:22-645(-)
MMTSSAAGPVLALFAAGLRSPSPLSSSSVLFSPVVISMGSSSMMQISSSSSAAAIGTAAGFESGASAPSSFLLSSSPAGFAGVAFGTSPPTTKGMSSADLPSSQVSLWTMETWIVRSCEKSSISTTVPCWMPPHGRSVICFFRLGSYDSWSDPSPSSQITSPCSMTVGCSNPSRPLATMLSNWPSVHCFVFSVNGTTALRHTKHLGF